MKQMLIALMLLGVVAYGAPQDAPKSVEKAFTGKYKNAKNIYWTTEEGNFVASFEHENLEKEATFKKDGTWLMTVTTIDTEDLMSCITDLLTESFDDPDVIDAAFVEKPDTGRYYVTIEKLTVSDDEEEEEEEDAEAFEGSNYTRLIFDADCTYLGEEQAKI